LKLPHAARERGEAANIPSMLEVSPGAFFGADRVSWNDCGYVANNKDYNPFSVTQSFQTPIKLSRVDVRGPTYGTDHEYSLGRPHRIDITLETSEDGNIWKTAGTLKGISGDADFLPIEFTPTTLQKIRLTATAEPYRAEYGPGMANPVVRWDWPYFVWRILTPRE